MKRLFIFTLLLAEISSRGAPPPLPDGPLIAAEAPAFARWTVNCTYAPGKTEADLNEGYKTAMTKMAAADPALAKLVATRPEMLVRKPRLQQIVVVKTGKVRVEGLVYTNGQHEERWQDGTATITRDAFTQKFSAGLANGEKEPDFPEFGWINAGNFKDIRLFLGRKCLIFEGKIDPSQVDDPRAFASGSPVSEEATVPVTAAIDLETRMPVSLQCRDQIRKYEFATPPTAALVIPPEFLAALREQDDRNKARTVHLSPP